MNFSLETMKQKDSGTPPLKYKKKKLSICKYTARENKFWK